MFCCKKKNAAKKKKPEVKKPPAASKSSDRSQRSSKSVRSPSKNDPLKRSIRESKRSEKSSRSTSKKSSEKKKKSRSRKDSDSKKKKSQSEDLNVTDKSEKSNKSKRKTPRIERCFDSSIYEPTEEVYPYLEKLPLKFDEVYLNSSIVDGKQIIEVSLQNEHPTLHNKRHLIVEIRFQEDILFTFYYFTKSKKKVYYKKLVNGSKKSEPYEQFLDWFSEFLKKKKWEIECFGISRKWGLVKHWPIELFESSILKECKTFRILNVGEEKLIKSLSHCKNAANLEICSGTLSDSFFDQEVVLNSKYIYLESVHCSITDETFVRLKTHKIFFHGKFEKLTEVAILDLIEKWSTGQKNMSSFTLFTTRNIVNKVLASVDQMASSTKWSDNEPRFKKMLNCKDDDPIKWLSLFHETYQIDLRGSNETCILFIWKNAVHLFFGKWTDNSKTKMTPEILKSELYTHKIYSDSVKHE